MLGTLKQRELQQRRQRHGGEGCSRSPQPKPGLPRRLRGSSCPQAGGVVEQRDGLQGRDLQDRCKYDANVKEDGKWRYLGTFNTPEEAALRYAWHSDKQAAKASECGKKRQREQQWGSHSLGPQHDRPQTGDFSTVVYSTCCMHTVVVTEKVHAS